MTIKEMLKKVEGYNEIAQRMTASPAVNLVFMDEDSQICHAWTRTTVTDYRAFANFVRRNYIPEVAGAILTYDGYEFDQAHAVALAPVFDHKQVSNFTFYLEYR